MSDPLRVVVATVGRFHGFDLAHQLGRRGYLAAVYTGLPRWLMRDSGVDPMYIRRFPWVQTPIQAMQKLRMMPGPAYRNLARWSHDSLDRHVARTMVPCHVLSAQSGTGSRAGAAAKARDTVYVCDRGSSHILYQDRILNEEYDLLGIPFPGIDRWMIDRHLEEYAEADAVTVPSAFVYRSFVECGVPEAKLHSIPYGVDLGTFRRSVPRDPDFRVLFVGALSVRKGLHYLLEGFAKAGLADARLVLVGSAQAETETILKRCSIGNVERTGPVRRSEVVNQMSRASVLVLPSVEEGLALVQAQAMACGCPLIVSQNTGGEDLLEDGIEGFIVPIRDADAIADRLTKLHGDRTLLAEMSETAVRRVHELGGWDFYGQASVQLFYNLARAKGHDIAPLER